MANRTSKTIGNVIKQARIKYEELMESEYISVAIKIDGKETRGQAQDADSTYSMQDKNSKLMTCMLDVPVRRGSYVEMEGDENTSDIPTTSELTYIVSDDNQIIRTLNNQGLVVDGSTNVVDTYSNKGLVTSIPNRTPVDYYFTVLFFNSTAQRRRNGYVYNDDGDIITNQPNVIQEIPCYVERIGARERQVDVGIDRNSVNKIITLSKYDIQKNDILYIGSDRYKITDIEELEKDFFSAYMTYYRE